MKKLAIITTHPIQYYAPVFKLLHQRQQVSVKVFYTWGEQVNTKYDPGFNKVIAWDIPLLEGYPFDWVKNTAGDPGSHHFRGIINPDLIGQLKAWQPDALLVYGWGYQSHLKILRHFKNKIPVLFRGDSTLLDEIGGTKALLKTAILKWIYRNVDYALYVGANNKAYFKKYGLKDENLIFAPHAIDNSRFMVEKKREAQLLRHENGISDEELLIIFAGKFEEKKAPLKLLEAFISLNAENAHLLFIGNGAQEAELRDKAKNRPHVHFMEFQNQSFMPVIYQACDLFCLPSNGPGETWGLAINEAMACGKAILSSDKVGAAIDLVQPGKNGAIFKAGSLADMVFNLNKLIAKGKIGLAEMGEHSSQLISKWNIEIQAKAIESVVNV